MKHVDCDDCSRCFGPYHLHLGRDEQVPGLGPHHASLYLGPHQDDSGRLEGVDFWFGFSDLSSLDD